MKKSFSILLLFILKLSFTSEAQINEKRAYEKAMEGIELMDNGKYEESIGLLEEAVKLDSERVEYPYEIAYAYFLMKEYEQSIKILEGLKTHKNVNAGVYQLLGNVIDINGDSEKAMKAYDEGLVKFPHSGALYLEKGNVHWAKKEYDQALGYYEKGIEVNPEFPSNYYRAARIYCASTEEVWGMIYGEIFMNLERNSDRTIEISKLLFDTYKSQITISKKSSTVSFCQQMVMSVDDISKEGDVKLPFCMVYEPNMALSVALEKEIDQKSLNNIRTSFLDSYYKNGSDKSHPNALFEYQKKVKEAGHFEAYNYWILMKGDEDEFDKWYKNNKDKYEAFVGWFTKNGLKLSDTNKFYRLQY